MKAVVLVGGEGTRMRPLTETIPKPLIPLVHRPFLDHVLDHLAAGGVTDVVLSSPFLGEAFERYVRAREGPPDIEWVTEDVPLGTGGAIANATRGFDHPFFVCNGDILTDLDLAGLLAFHRSREAMATITLTEVPDARPYGLVEMGEGGRVVAFWEKPADPVPGMVNAGTYVLDPQAVAGVAPGRQVSVERDVFPALIAAARPVYGLVSPAYWRDLGTPEQYLQATFDVLEGRVAGLSAEAPFVHPSANVALRAQLGRWVVVGEGARVGHEAEVEDSVLLAGSVVEPGARIRDSILGPLATVGARAILAGAVLAEGARVPAGAVSEGARVSAGRALGG